MQKAQKPSHALVQYLNEVAYIHAPNHAAGLLDFCWTGVCTAVRNIHSRPHQGMYVCRLCLAYFQSLFEVPLQMYA